MTGFVVILSDDTRRAIPRDDTHIIHAYKHFFLAHRIMFS